LRDVGIDYIGAGETEAKILPVIREVKGLKIAFLGYGYGPNEYEATLKSAGLALMNIEKLKSDVQSLGPQVDLIVVVMHDGIEYVNDPAVHQKEFARAAIEAGADLVLGHHPHVVQKMEIYNGKYIFYSLGNYIFDQMWSLETRQGLGIMFHLDKSGVTSLDYYPVRIEDYCQPNWAVGAEREAIISRLQ
jgi:poly-gamma-glutamate synthesis protein (capsule biosynthesis protein)